MFLTRPLEGGQGLLCGIPISSPWPRGQQWSAHCPVLVGLEDLEETLLHLSDDCVQLSTEAQRKYMESHSIDPHPHFPALLCQVAQVGPLGPAVAKPVPPGARARAPWGEALLTRTHYATATRAAALPTAGTGLSAPGAGPLV